MPPKKWKNHNPKASNGKRSLNSSDFDPQKRHKTTSLENAVFRVLCPLAKIGSVIGDDENVISQILEETGEKIRLCDPVSGCDERVIYVMGSDDGVKTDTDESSKSMKERGGSEDEGKSDAQKDSTSKAEVLCNGTGMSSVQTALLRLCEKFIEREEEADADNGGNEGSGAVTLRLLVLSSQVGCVLGKGGVVIKQLSADSGAQIRILPRDKLPLCASSSDDVVQITGASDAVKKAIRSVSDQILKNPVHDHDSFPSKPIMNLQNQAFPRFGDSDRFQSSYPSMHPKLHPLMPPRMDVPDILTFRLLCPDERVGGVIGKGGAVIKTLKLETGCEIRVLEGTSDGEERLIIVSGPAHPDDGISVVQEAVLRVQHCIAKALPDSKEKGAISRILVPCSQIGCILGKGGAIIAEMRKVTGAYIRILGKDQLPKCASEHDEIIQINGELEKVQEAVLHVTTRLVHHHFFRDTFPPNIYPPHPAFSDGVPLLPSFMGRIELSPSRMFPQLGPIDAMGGPPLHGGFGPRGDPLFMNDIQRHEIPHFSGRPWHPQASMEGGNMGIDYAGAPHRFMSRYNGENHHAVITSTTVEVVVPSSVVPSICGENGGCLKQIRQISNAKITIVNPKPGAFETMVVISGTPEQTHAAQSLIQAFVMLENEAS